MIGDLNGEKAPETAAEIARETGNDCRGREEFIASYKLNTISAYRMRMACLPHLEKAENAAVTKPTC